MRRERVEGAIVHVRQELGRRRLRGLRRTAPGDAHLDRPGLGLSGLQLVPERREADREPLVVPGHEDRLGRGHELVVAQNGELHREPAAVLLGDRNLDELGVAPRDEARLPDAAPVAVDLEEQRLLREPGRHEEARGLPDRDRVALRQQNRRERQRRPRRGDEDLARHGQLGAELVGGAVVDSVGAGGEPPQRNRRLALRVVRQLPSRDLGAVFPARQDALGSEARLPTRTQGVSGGVEGVRVRDADAGRRVVPNALVFLGRLVRRLVSASFHRLVGGQPRRLRLLQARQPPRALAGARHAVQTGSQDAHARRLALAQEAARRIDRGLDGDETQAKRAGSRPRLAALVGRVRDDRVRVRDALPRRVLALVGPRGEAQGEGSVGRQRRRPGRDRLRLDSCAARAAAPAAPPGPPRILRRARDVPVHLSGGDRQAEVVARLARQMRRAVQPQRLLRIHQRDLEGGALVLLHADRGRPAAERAPHAPGAQGAARRDRELAGRRPVGVGRRGAGDDGLAVGVHQRDRHRGLRRDLEAPLQRFPAIRQHLPIKGLRRAIDASVGEDQRRRDLRLRLPGHPVRGVHLQGEVVPGAREHETLAPLLGIEAQTEPGETVLVGRVLGFALDAGRIPFPAIDRHGRARDRPARRPGEGAQLEDSLVHAVRPGRGGPQQHEVAEEHARGLERRAGAAEGGRPRRRDHPEALPLHRGDGVGGVRAIVGRLWQLQRPFGVGRTLHQLAELVVLREHLVRISRARDPRGKVQTVGAEPKPRDVLVRHQDRTALCPVGPHRPNLILRRLDAPNEGETAAAADGVRIRRQPLLRRRPRMDQRIAGRRRFLESGELALSHREPGKIRHRREPPGEIGGDRGSVLFVRERDVENAQTLEPRLEGGLAPFALRVPRLEVREHRHGLGQGMRGGIVEAGHLLTRTGTPGVAPLPEQARQVQAEELVGLRGAPTGGVRQERREEIRDGVAQGPANVRRIVVGLDELREARDGIAAQRLALCPDREVRAPRLVPDLLARPRLQVDRSRGFDALALPDLPRVRVRVVDQRLRVEELERRARQDVRRPRPLLQETHRGLRAVKSHPKLRGSDQRPGPLRGVVTLLGRVEERLNASEGLLELLFGDQAIDLRPRRRRRRRECGARVRSGCRPRRDRGTLGRDGARIGRRPDPGPDEREDRQKQRQPPQSHVHRLEGNRSAGLVPSEDSISTIRRHPEPSEGSRNRLR